MAGVDINLLKKRGISSGDFKAIFTNPKKPARVQKLIDLISNRVLDGYRRNLSDHRIYAAIDLAYDTPFNQTTPTFIQNLLSKNLKAEELLKEVERMGLKEEDLFLSVKNPNGTMEKWVNPPVFYQVLLPIVVSYCTAITANLFNPRNKSPLLPFHPIKKTSRNRIICEVVTDLVQKITTWYGYSSYLEQAIKQMVKYGVAISFPVEEWNCENQLRLGKDEKEEVVTDKEGIRYLFPHPSRMFYDLYHPLPAMNTGTGGEFTGHWQVVPYSELLDERKYWNRDCISYGTNWLNHPLAGNYFSEFFPCRLQFPIVGTDIDASRQDKAAFYSTSDRDKAVFLTHVYMKIVPKTFGLGRYEVGKDKKLRLTSTYDYPVWHHFIVAGDSTVIWAEPCAYIPNWFMGYNYDAQAGRQTSYALEVIPWQDHLSNILTQMNLTAKQNLANVIFYDTNSVNKTDVDMLMNLGERKYRSLNFLPYDSFKSNRGVSSNPREAFVPVQLNYRTIQDMIQMMNALLTMMERVQQLTAQELGGSAQHYQSAAEVKITKQASSQRADLIGASIDAGTDAWKRQIYTAAMAYLDSDFESQVSAEIPDVEKILAELGFNITEKFDDKIVIKGKKEKLQLEDFAKSGEGIYEQDTDQSTAQVLFSTIGIIAAHPEILQNPKLVSLLEQATRMGGADRDFKLPIANGPAQPGAPGQPTMEQQIVPLLQQLQESILKIVEEKVAKPAAEAIGKQQGQIEQLGGLVKQIEEVLVKIVQPQPPVPQPMPMQPPVAPIAQ